MIAIWTNHLSIANRTIDTAHRQIFNTINNISKLIEARDDTALREALISLENSLCAYFEVEEKFARALNVDFDQHKLAHQQLLNDIHKMSNALAEKNGQWPGEDVEAFATPWTKRFIRHIKDEGKQMKVVLSSQYYDFQPD